MSARAASVARRRVLSACVVIALGASALLACSFVESLDYLQNGAATTEKEASAGDGPSGAVPTVLAPGQVDPMYLAEDASALYWLADNDIMTIPKAGGTARIVGSVQGVTALAVDPAPDGNVYLGVDADVVSLGKQSGVVTKVFTAATGAPPVNLLAADDTFVFVLEIDPQGTLPSQIVRMGADGGAPTVLENDAASTPSTLNIDDASVTWFDTDTNGGNGAFFVQAKQPSDGGSTQELDLKLGDSVPQDSTGIVLDDQNFYWVTADTVPTVLYRARQPQASTITLYRGADSSLIFDSLASDATALYVLETTNNAIIRVPKDGSAASTIVSGLDAPTSVVVDATQIYVALASTNDKGSIVTFAK